MMNDPIQHIFNQAADNGLRLNNLFQTQNGLFRANWRRDHLTPPANCSEFVDSRDPFHALKDSLAVALNTLPAPKQVAVSFSEMDAALDDLFGGL